MTDDDDREFEQPTPVMEPEWHRIRIEEFDDHNFPWTGDAVLLWKGDERASGESLVIGYWCTHFNQFVAVAGQPLGWFSSVAEKDQGYPTHWSHCPKTPYEMGIAPFAVDWLTD